jgi:hypothetical protein
MHEFRVAPEDFIELYRDPAMPFDLAIGILGEVAATKADHFRNVENLDEFSPHPTPRPWQPLGAI